jgi:RNA polymerase sigma-70 factor, ECF subfamily
VTRPQPPESDPVTIDAAVQDTIDAVYRAESRRVLATLIRLLGDFDLAEDALQDAFAAAVRVWPREGVPRNPRAWLVSAGRFRAIDRIRRRARFDASTAEIAGAFGDDVAYPAEYEGDDDIADDRLRLIFTCCHPALSREAQVPLTLREVCGLTTEEIAHAFLIPAPTLAQRIVRAKRKIRDARIPYDVPQRNDLPQRMDAVLQVVYLVFNEGYSASRGEELTRADLCTEAIQLGRLLAQLLPEPEVLGLLALMLLHDSRRSARATPEGDVILLDDQDRRLWDRDMIAEGSTLVHRAIRQGPVGPYCLQAAIAALHAAAPTPEETDWTEIAGLYEVLLQVSPSPVIELNRAVAVSMRDGPEAGLALLETLLARGGLEDYYLAHAARADMYRRLARRAEARAAYVRALSLTQQEPQRRFLARRLQELA